MKACWLTGYTNKDREARKKEVLGYRNAFDALREVLERNYKKREAVRDYAKPNWMAEQIAVNEYNQALDDILGLINLTDNKE